MECPRCGYTTPRKDLFLGHINRQKLCEALLSNVSLDDIRKEFEPKEKRFKCECGSSYTHQSSYYRHKKICRGLSNNNTCPSLIGGTSIGINNGTINIQQNIVVNVKNFGRENLSHIESNNQLLRSCLMSKDVKRLIENIHCDKTHPENHNVRIKSTKNNFMETYVDGKWIVTDSEDTLTDLIQNGYRIMRMYSHKNRQNLSREEEEYDEVMAWLESIYDDKKIQKPIKRQLLLLFINNRMMLLGKD